MNNPNMNNQDMENAKNIRIVKIISVVVCVLVVLAVVGWFLAFKDRHDKQVAAPQTTATPEPSKASEETLVPTAGPEELPTATAVPTAMPTPEPTATPEPTPTSVPLTPEGVRASVQLYEGYYVDTSVDFSLPESEMEPYYFVKIENVIDTAFDFTIYIADPANGTEEVVFNTHTAVFIDDGDVALFVGETHILDFGFPDDFESLPVAVAMEIGGFDEIEGRLFANNSIPGHEFG